MTVNLSKLTNSLFISLVNVVLVAITFVFLVFPRFTRLAQFLALLVVILTAFDVVLVLRDLWRSGTRGRALAAGVLWLPVLFLIAMVNQWEGPLYASASGNPLVFDIRGAASFCGLKIYSPDQEKAEWYGDDIGLIWSIEHATNRHFPVNAEVTYGNVPSEFVQQVPLANAVPPPLDPAVTYKVVMERCMGGPQNFSLRKLALAEYEANPQVCWGELKVSERQNPAWVRVDCRTRKLLPMSQRAKQRLQAYRENHIPFY